MVNSMLKFIFLFILCVSIEAYCHAQSRKEKAVTLYKQLQDHVIRGEYFDNGQPRYFLQTDTIGELITETIYSWHPNGQPDSICMLKAGVQDHRVLRWDYWYANGSRKKTIACVTVLNYSDYKSMVYQKEWYDNGQLKTMLAG